MWKKINSNGFGIGGGGIVSVVILACGLGYMFKGFHEFGIGYGHFISLGNGIWIIIDLFYVAYNTHRLIQGIKYKKRFKKIDEV